MTIHAPRPGSIRDRLAVARTQATRRGVLRANDGLEVSIPAIVIAIVISVAISAAVVLGLIWVVPFAQNSNAQSELGTIQSAENLYSAQNSKYADQPTLLAGGANAAIKQGKDTWLVALSPTANAYCAAIKSVAGVSYWASSNDTVVGTVAPTVTGVTCPTP